MKVGFYFINQRDLYVIQIQLTKVLVNSSPRCLQAEYYSNFCDRFEEGDEGTQLNFTLEEHIQIPITLIPSLARQDGPQRGQSTTMPWMVKNSAT